MMDFHAKHANHLLHGWGLHNVTQAVEKYNGTILFEYENGIFTASAMLFFPAKQMTDVS